METKIPAFPILEPLSMATQTALKPLTLLDTDFLEIDVDKDVKHFIASAVCLRKCEANILPNDDITYVTTPEGAYYKDEKYYNYPSRNAAISWFRRIPERVQKSYGKWRLAGTDFTALIIHHVWPHHKLIFKSEEAILLYTILLKRFLTQSKNAVIGAKWNLNNEIPEMPKDFIEHPKLPLNPYQKVALMMSLGQEVYALLMEQGTGKTPIVINRVCLEGARKRASKKGMYRCLVLCPQQVRLNWEREFERFATVPGKTSVLRGGQIGKVRDLIDGVRTEEDCAWSACILSMDSVNSIWEALKKVEWDLVVIDESHKIKNPNTQRFSQLMELDNRRAMAKMILTGTPITNTIFDLWSQFEWLGNGLSGFSTYSNFRSFHGAWKTESAGDGTAVQKLAGFKNIPLIQERLARLAFLILKKDANLNLPDKVYDLYEVAMMPKQADLYKRIAAKLVVEIDNELATAQAEGSTITANHILTKLLRLAQVTSGFVKIDDIVDLQLERVTKGNIIQISEHNPKILATVKMLKEDWEADPNSKIVIWAHFIEDIRALSEALAKGGINHVGYHHAVSKEFRVADSAAAELVINRDRDCKVMIANPASGGTGLNILGYDVEKPDEYDTYINHEIYFSCNWSAVDRIQSEDRSHRRGTRTNVRITDLVVPFTIDVEIRERVRDKRRMAMSIQDIREILNNVLRNYK